MHEELNKLISSYIDLCNQTEEQANKIGEIICKKLKPVIPDLEYSTGWAESGIDTLCFWSKKHAVNNDIIKKIAKGEEVYLFADVVTEVLPNLSCHIDTPYGIYLTREEAEQIQNILKKET